MSRREPQVSAIPLHRGFADALAAGLIARHGDGPLGPARGIVLLPNSRAERAVRDAFVRQSNGGLLLPRLISIGDPALDDRIGAALDPLTEGMIPPAIDRLARQLILARLIEDVREAARQPVDAGEAMRLAAELGRTLDQLIVEEVDPAKLREAVPVELADHWQASLAMLELVLSRWPEELTRRGLIDLAARRNRLLDATAKRWAATPPAGFVVAAGISAAGPAVARLLKVIAWLPEGEVVLAGLDRTMPPEEWAALEPEEGRPIETHPQLGLRRLLDRLGVARGEVKHWRGPGGANAEPARSRAIGNAMAPAEFTDRWQRLRPHERRIGKVRTLELATPAAEAMAIAVALREALEMPERTAALVTPDRGLAARVSAHLKRWGIDADDSAGRPLSTTAPGTLLLAVADALAEDFAPVPLLGLLKHPLVCSGEGRGAWLEGVRRLDRALRGPRPRAGLAGITTYLTEGEGWQAKDRGQALPFWNEIQPLLAPLAEAPDTFAGLLAALREGAESLAGDAAWAQTAGRGAAELLEAIELGLPDGPSRLKRDGFPALLRLLLDGIAVRPPQGGHPRIFIWGLIEARLQRADLTILGGLNDGVWPSLPAPDPWLAPAIRGALGLPGLEARIGTEAQQFAAALGGPEVLITRARRDARSPTVPSRFWLRLEAMTGGLARCPTLGRWAAAIDAAETFRPASQPKPKPPLADRPKHIAVTKLDRLKADPFAFYADQMLKLRSMDAVDADPSPAWRGTAVHRILDAWAREDACEPALLRPRAETLLRDTAAHPVVRAMWTPRLLEAIDWIAATVAENRAEGRRILQSEIEGRTELFGITLEGTADRIDRLPDGRLAIVDYKTGKPPSNKAVAEGYSLQLGLLGLIAEKRGFDDVDGTPIAFEYWSLAAGKAGTLGHIASPVGLNKKGEGIAPEDFTTRAARVFEVAVHNWLLGEAAFTAKLHPEYAPYGDYDQLMRLDEWYGRADGTESAA
jgi:ATP-dependent helicase/nuclease subunit B